MALVHHGAGEPEIRDIDVAHAFDLDDAVVRGSVQRRQALVRRRIALRETAEQVDVLVENADVNIAVDQILRDEDAVAIGVVVLSIAS